MQREHHDMTSADGGGPPSLCRIKTIFENDP
jgi:hypothetical protein